MTSVLFPAQRKMRARTVVSKPTEFECMHLTGFLVVCLRDNRFFYVSFNSARYARDKGLTILPARLMIMLS